MKIANVRAAACTIATPKQLPAAWVLARSFALQYPASEFTILLLDDGSTDPGAPDLPARTVRLRDLDSAPVHPHQFAAAYDPAGLATVARPLLLRQLFRAGTEVILYFDPGIYVLSEMNDVFSLTAETGLALTPLARRPESHDRHQAKDKAGIWSGTYDLGFLGIRNDQQAFLDLWAEQVADEYDAERESGSQPGQRWLDAAPSVFSCAVIAGAGYDAAYWNLGERDLELVDGQYRVDGDPLRFFHFRGFDPSREFLLTTDTHAGRRISLADRPVLRNLCRGYAQRLLDQSCSAAKLESSFDTLLGEVPFDNQLRRLFRRWRKDKLPPEADPFTQDRALEFLFDVANPTDAEPLPSLISDEWRRRPDLQALYPHPEGSSRRGLMEWARAEVGYGRLHPLLAPAPEFGDDGTPADVAWAKAPDLRGGICIAGYLRGELGLGQQARLLLDTVKRAAVPWGTYVFRLTQSRQAHPVDELPANDLNTNIIAVVPDQLEYFVKEVGEDFLENRYNIGFWAWELEDLPERSWGALKYVDEIWAVSDFSRSSFAAITDKPVFTFPNPVVAPKVPSGPIDRSQFGLPEGYLFLFVFDFFSEIERKNPLGLITAFSNGFREGEGPVLAIKAVNGDARPHDLERLKVAAADRSDIIILDQYLSSNENAALMATCDCYVSLHRGEGFGLTLAEAMALGKPTIATGFSGNLQFMTEDNSFLVPWTEARVPPDCGPYPEGSRWAEPDLGEATRFLRHVYLDREDAARRAARGRTITERHGIDARVGFIQERFRHAQEVLQSQSQPSSNPVPTDSSPLDPPVSAPGRSRPARLISDLLRPLPVGRQQRSRERTENVLSRRQI